ncbi:MAG: ABC transporter substrate-binding protein [Verrucomicrobiales bacterium]|nr:ABC transporter substrate-binding protein [Verrucomicrobiales bacterium]
MDRWSILLMVLLLFAVLTAYGEDNGNRDVSLQLKWRHQFQFAGYYAADFKGFFAEEGLNVKLMEGGPSNPPLERVLSGDADFGVSDSNILLARMKGEPIVACSTFFQHSPYAFISLKSSKISTPSDLIGRKIMTSGAQGAAQLHALLKREGLPLDRIEFVPHSWDLGALVSGRVDVISGYTTAETFQLRKLGFDPGIIKASEYGVDFYGDTLFTKTGYVERNRSAVDSVMRASVKGWEYAMANPDEVIDYILTLPGVSERGIERANLEFEAQAMRELILPELVELGHMNSGRWQQIAMAYQGADVSSQPRNDNWFDGFLYEDHLHSFNMRKWAIAVSSLLIGGLGVLVWNLGLRRKVDRQTNEVLRGERKLQAILDNSNNVLGLLSADGRLVELNQKGLEFAGLDRSEVLGAPFSESPLWKGSSGVVERIAKGIDHIQLGGKGSGIRMETEHLGMDGSIRTLDFSLRAVTGSDDKLEFIVAEGIDITERKAVAVDLETSRASLSSLVEHTRGLIWSVDRDGILINSNRPFRQAFWRRTGETIRNGQSVFDYFGEKESKQWKCHFQRAFGGDRFTAEVVVMDPTGAQIHEASFHPIMKNGKNTGINIFEFDVSERKRSAEALQQSAELNQLLLDSALDAVVGVDADGRIVHWNGQAVEVFGYSIKEAVGSPVSQILPELDKRIDRDLADCDAYRFELEATRSDRSTFPAEVSLSVLPTGHQVALNLFVRDVTMHRRLEEKLRQSQKMEAIGQLAGGVAHDFNNLLTVIQGNASLIKDDPGLDKQGVPAVEEIISASERAASLTGQLLAFSRQQPMQSKIVTVNESAESVSRMLTRLIGEDIRLETNLCKEPACVKADKGMLEQVFLNLAVNGRDAMPQGGLLSIETTVVELFRNSTELPSVIEPGEFVRIDIKDTGKGIPPEALPHIFEPFFTTKEVGKGTGLGLATVFGIVEQHNGWLDVESKIDHGTTFSVWLPKAVEVGSAPCLNENRNRPAGELNRGSETILLVEDEEMLRMIARKILTKFGYRVLEAHNGRHALGVWEQFGANVDLLLTDIVMPEGMSGHDLALRLQEEKPTLKVIYSSGYSAEIFRGNAEFPEGASFIGKPYLPNDLLNEVRMVLDNVALAS